MGLKDAHDPRPFRHFAKVSADGTILGIVESFQTASDTAGTLHIEVTDLYPYDFTGITLVSKTVKGLALELQSKNLVSRGR